MNAISRQPNSPPPAETGPPTKFEALAPMLATSRHRPDAPYTAEEVIGRMEEAGRVLLSLPHRGHTTGMRTFWPQVVQAAAEAYGYTDEAPMRVTPAAAEISRMDETWRWIALIPLEPGRKGGGEPFSRHGGAVLRRIVLMRALTHPGSGRQIWSWRKIGSTLGCSHETVQSWHARGVDAIVIALNRKRDKN